MKLMKFTIGCVFLIVYFFVGLQGLFYYLVFGILTFALFYGLLRGLGGLLTLLVVPPVAAIAAIFILSAIFVPLILLPYTPISIVSGGFLANNVGAMMGVVLGSALAFHIFLADFWWRD